jgi:hypothetical protein
MKIAVRMEGGLGDHLLANRFLFAIKEKFSSAGIKIFSDTEGNSSSLNVLKKLFPEHYNNSEVVQYRKDKNFQIETPTWGKEHYPAHINNMPEEVLQEINSADKFYDLHIDGLKWLKYDFDWLKYYYFFPTPRLELKSKIDPGYILMHLYARPGSPYNLEKQYATEIVQKLAINQKVVIVTQESDLEFYSKVSGLTNVKIETPDNVLDIFSLASGCAAFLGIDSGIRYIPYHFSKPTFVLSKNCKKFGSPYSSHLIRWLLFPNHVIPIGMEEATIVEIIKQSLKNPAAQIFPQLLLNQNINQTIVNRFE